MSIKSKITGFIASEREAARTEREFHKANVAKLRQWDAVPAFPGFGVHVRDGQVYSGAPYEPKLLGAVAGAKAVVTDGAGPSASTQVSAAVLAGPIGLIAASAGRRATGFIVFTDGSVHERELNGDTAIHDAQADVVRFNALARTLT